MATDICCCNYAPPSKQCGFCNQGQHEACMDPAMPSRPRSIPRPTPSIKRPNPSDPGRTTEASRWGGIFMWAFVFVMAGLFALAVYTVATSDRTDPRETRHFGNLECVYNVRTDEVEDCVLSPDNPR